MPSSSLTENLALMDAVDHVRQATPAPPATPLEEVSARIAHLYRDQEIPLSPDLVTAAANHYLAKTVAPTELTIGWDRPATPTAWETRCQDLAEQVVATHRRVTRRSNTVETIALVAVLGAIGWVGHSIWVAVAADGLFAQILKSMGMVALSGAVAALFATGPLIALSRAIERPHRRLKAEAERFQPYAPNVKRLKEWAAYPRVAQVIANLHASGVPLLNADAEALDRLVVDEKKAAKQAQVKNEQQAQEHAWATALKEVVENVNRPPPAPGLILWAACPAGAWAEHATGSKGQDEARGVWTFVRPPLELQDDPDLTLYEVRLTATARIQTRPENAYAKFPSSEATDAVAWLNEAGRVSDVLILNPGAIWSATPVDWIGAPEGPATWDPSELTRAS